MTSILKFCVCRRVNKCDSYMRVGLYILTTACAPCHHVNAGIKIEVLAQTVDPSK